MRDTSFHQSLERARQALFGGEIAQCISILGELEVQSNQDALKLQQIAELYVHCGQHVQANRCYARSVKLEPRNPDILFNLATSKFALGDLDEAESLFSQVIKLNPKDYGAWLNRSITRKQTVDNNHVEQLKYVRAHLENTDQGNIQLCYALAKELEDIGRHHESFEFLQEGSARRRQRLQYDIGEDERALATIARCFDEKLLLSQPPSYPSDRPLFILGLPRSGTTLVDRIVSSHSQAASLGEHNTLAFVLMRETGATETKQELIERSANIDFATLGRRYCDGIEGFGESAPRLIDKTPFNFLYLGLIHLSMPGAKIIHLRRNPLDVCYAIYKTLFRTGYPFSYSLQDVGRYYIAYHRLMSHWRDTIPGSFLDVDYESLIGDQEGETRRILDYLGLEWEDDCLEFHRHSGPAATASAAQVRQPIYSSSVGLWRKYAKQLAPFAGKLREHGIDVKQHG
jgi:tetratricopeptide (TPR) repeat protein